MLKKGIIAIILIASMFSLSACSKDKAKVENEVLTKTELFMGTVVKVSIYEGGNDEALEKAFDRVKEIENLVSINKEGTELDKLNDNAGEKSVTLSDDSINIINKGLEYSKLSEGTYDISIGPLVKLWSIGLDEAKVPTEDEIGSVLDDIDYNDVKVEGNDVFLKQKNMLLDLGSIAKGYTADEVAKVLKENGVTKAVIDLGGNVYVMGKKSEDKGWKIGVQNPFSQRGDVIGSIVVSDKSVVTTGVYERYIEEDGKKYHHVLNPKTGYPYETEIAGITIIADNSIDADALSTLVFTMGVKDGINFIENKEGVDAIFVTNNKKVYKTSGMSNNFELMNNEFILEN